MAAKGFERMHVAVIGSGIAGLSAAWLAARAARVTLIEKDGRLGGHSNTVDVGVGTEPIPVDTGFIVYNTACYPNLVALFDHLAVPTAPTAMSFAVSLENGSYEYAGSGVRGLFGQASNILSLPHWRMSGEILRFFREAGAAERLGEVARPERETLGEWLADRGYSRTFIDRHIVPMGAAIWSSRPSDVLGFPSASFFRFFANHGLLQVRRRPPWRTVAGGSREYVRRLIAAAQPEIVIGAGAARIERPSAADGPAAPVTIRLTDGRTITADRVIIATHADEALALLADADDDERRVLGAFRYRANRAVLHRDPSLMPTRRGLWSSWNVIGRTGAPGLCTTYWMNRLQPLATKTDHFVTLEPPREIAERHVLADMMYTHPQFDAAAITAQRALPGLQGRRSSWFAGSYFGYGFHEDGIQAGLNAAEGATDARRPWSVPDDAWDRMPRTIMADTALARSSAQ